MTGAAVPRGAVCGGCGTELAPAALACPGCRRLVHSETLKALSSEAQQLEGGGDLAGALAAWKRAQALVPTETRQHTSITEHLTRLSALAPAPAPTTSSTIPPWARQFGPIAVGLFALWKLVGVGKAVAFASLLASFLVYWQAWGWAFAAGFLVSLYLHELGHVVALRRAGLPASPPMFIPGLGAYVRLHARPKDLRTDAQIGLAGPVVGLVVAAAFQGAAMLTGSGLLRAIAHTGAFINLLNLVPLWQLDGSRGFGALGRAERILLVGLTGFLLATTGERALWLILIPGAFRALSPRVPTRPDVAVLLTFGGLVTGLTLLAVAAG